MASQWHKEGGLFHRLMLTLFHFRHLGEHGLPLTFQLQELTSRQFGRNNSFIMPISKSGKPHEQDRFHRPFSLLCPAAKILEWLLFATIVEALGNRPYQHGKKTEALHHLGPAPHLCRVVSGFNQRKPPSKTIDMAVDISKAFDKVWITSSVIEMIHRSRLRHNLIRWLVAYLRGRKASWLYQQHNSPSPLGAGGGFHRISHHPSPL